MGPAVKIASSTSGQMDPQKALAKNFISQITEIDGKFTQHFDPTAKIDWPSLCFQDDSKELLDSLLKYLPTAMSNNAFFTKNVFKTIVCPLFCGPQSPDTVSQETTERVFNSAHQLVKLMIQNAPNVSKMVVKCLKQGCPYHAPKNISAFSYYLGNILLTSEYLDQPSVIQFVTDKLFIVDVNCLHAPDNLQMLDKTLHSILTSLQRTIEPTDLNSEKRLDLLDCFFSSFKEIILPSTKCIGSQFAIFYLASQHEDLAAKLASNLLSLINGEITQITDLTSNVVTYLASFLCTCVVAPVHQTILFIQWCVNYLQEYLEETSVSCSPLDVTQHRVFHLIFQAVLNVICARHNELMHHHSATLQACDFQRLINSPLNPLAVCSDDLLSSFLPVASSLRLAFCSAIIHRNCRSEYLPLKQKSCQLLQPFGSIELTSSSALVEPYMRTNT